ncbi:Putative glutathione-dependent formaldehyde-activating enzyme [Tsuneonella dongtanensis]|uniref:Putative glutathione-dependent formaldehyde-activating enzyme n=1 Tax=Tsuneonella dongtanensis TaxID=692370 RepID=A0A1B2AFJ0_9SPHN|nr:GFA family protein [Tsuneonella dongtanensis]ANY20881.1 Putative glutathione-dependent formaldehyde-activating enzyme [Tsuneonella dongtanensis]
MNDLFADTLEGGCNCGAVRYTLSPGFRIGPYACHCTLCQTRTGSAFAEHTMVSRAALAVTGAQKCGKTANPSGAEVTLWGCNECGARVWGENASRPGFATLRCGTLDLSAEVVPVGHIWVSSKQPWIALPEGAKAMDEQPRTPEEWMRELGTAA